MFGLSFVSSVRNDSCSDAVERKRNENATVSSLEDPTERNDIEKPGIRTMEEPLERPLRGRDTPENAADQERVRAPF